jgi:hypothetical protein
MAKAREDLHEILVDILGSNHVYFQPPETLKMDYPAIVYELNNIGSIHADNRVYYNTVSYMVTYIAYDPEPMSEINRKLLQLPLCSFNRSYTADNLNHFVYTIYF